MTEQFGKIGFCAELDYSDIEERYVAAYGHIPGLTEDDVRRSHRYWRNIGKLAKNGSLTGRKYV